MIYSVSSKVSLVGLIAYHHPRQDGPVAAAMAPTTAPAPPNRPPKEAEKAMLVAHWLAPPVKSPASASDSSFMVMRI